MLCQQQLLTRVPLADLGGAARCEHCCNADGRLWLLVYRLHEGGVLCKMQGELHTRLYLITLHCTAPRFHACLQGAPACLHARQVWIPYFSQFRSKQVWKHATEFRPERWLRPPENEQEQYTAGGAACAAGVGAGGPASCPATGHGAMQDDASGGCPFLRAQGLTAAQGGQAAAASGLSGSALAAPANQPTLAQALAKFGTAAKAALGLERYTGRPGEAPQAPGTVKGTPMTPSWQGHEKAFTPFGHGARTCPAKSMVMIEMRLFLVRLLSQYKVSFADPEAEQPVEAYTFLTYAADSRNPGKMVFTKRVRS